MEGDAAEILSHPTRVGVYGQSGSGKTHFVLNQILRDPRVTYDRIIWCCEEYSAKQPEIAKLGEKGYIKTRKDDKHKSRKIPFLLIPASEGWQGRLEHAISEGEEAAGEGEPPLKQLVVLDDLMEKSAGVEGKIFSRLYTGGRHRGLSVMELLQRCFPNAASRTHRVNCEMHVCFAMGARDEARRLFQQCAPADWRKLASAYQKITEESPHGCVIIDQRHHKKYPALRYRTSLEDCLILDD